MDPITAGAIIGGGVNLVGDLFNQSNARSAFQHRYQDTVKDMRKAGLNPALAYGQGGGNPQTAPIGDIGSEISGAVANSKQTKINREQADANIGYTRAQTSLLNAQAQDIATITRERARQAGIQTGIYGEKAKQAVSDTTIRGQQALQAPYNTTVAREKARQAPFLTTSAAEAAKQARYRSVVGAELARAAPFNTQTAKARATHAQIINELASRLNEFGKATYNSNVAAQIERNLSPALRNTLDQQNIDIREVARAFAQSNLGKTKPTQDMVRQWLELFLRHD